MEEGVVLGTEPIPTLITRVVLELELRMWEK